MGMPFFTWWPHQSRTGTTRQTITLTEDLSDLQIMPKRDVVDTYAIDGGRVRELLRPYVDVRIVLERYTDRDLFRRFNSMINHLERGGVVAFGLDSAKAWACRLDREAGPNAISLTVGANETTTYHADSASASPSVGDELTIESSPPIAKREQHLVESVTALSPGFKISIDDSDVVDSLYDYFPAGSLVRHSDFFPTLILPQSGVGAMSNTHDHRISYTLDLTLTYLIPRTEVEVPNQYSNTNQTITIQDKPDYEVAAKPSGGVN
jgi:hypothetical protein